VVLLPVGLVLRVKAFDHGKESQFFVKAAKG
jgi:hypothetical protein